MPRYFFALENASSSVPDLVGRELPDGAAARAEAAKAAAEVATVDAVEGRPPTYQWVEVCDEHHRPIARLPVADVIREPNRMR